MIAVLAAWSAALAAKPTPKAPKLPEWLVAEPATSLHPLFPTTRTDRVIHGLVHPRLFEPVGDDWTSSVVADLAVDGLVATITVASRTWTDGQPLVGADVCATFARLADAAHPTQFTAVAGAAVASCEADPASPAIARLTLTRARPELRPWLAVPILPAHRPDWIAFTGGAVEPAFVGLGAVVPRREGADVVLPDAWRFRVVEDPLGRFRAGEGTRAFAPPDALAALRAQPGVIVETFGRPTVWALVLDASAPPLDDRDLRRAIDRGIDRAAIAAALFGRDEGLPKQPWTPVSGPWPATSARTARGVPVPIPPVEPYALPALKVVAPAALADRAEAAFPTFEVTAVDPRGWWLSVLAGAHRETADAALVPFEEPVCAWLASDGPRDLFGAADEEIDRLCARGALEDAWSLHGRLADEVPVVFLAAVQDRVATRVAPAPAAAP